MSIQKKREYRDAVIRIRDCAETLKAALVTDSHSPKQIEDLAKDIAADLPVLLAYAAYRRNPTGLDRADIRLDQMIETLQRDVLAHSQKPTDDPMAVWLAGPRLDPMPQPGQSMAEWREAQRRAYVPSYETRTQLREATLAIGRDRCAHCGHRDATARVRPGLCGDDATCDRCARRVTADAIKEAYPIDARD